MCIEGSVGTKGRNQRADVIAVKVLLNYGWVPLVYAPLTLDGQCDAIMKDRILDYQTRALRQEKADGRVDAGGGTLKALRRLMPLAFDAAKLRAIMPQASKESVELYYKHLLTEMETRSINTPLRRAHFLAQLAHESGCFLYNEEIASGAAYEGRKKLGNTEAGDGKRFKGRGLIQLTGRSNYQAYGDAIGRDLTKDGNWTQVATDPVLAVGAAGWFWETKGLNTVADTDDIVKVTLIVNGGANGLADRQKYLARARYFLLP